MEADIYSSASKVCTKIQKIYILYFYSTNSIIFIIFIIILYTLLALISNNKIFKKEFNLFKKIIIYKVFRFKEKLIIII